MSEWFKPAPYALDTISYAIKVWSRCLKTKYFSSHMRAVSTRIDGGSNKVLQGEAPATADVHRQASPREHAAEEVTYTNSICACESRPYRNNGMITNGSGYAYDQQEPSDTLNGHGKRRMQDLQRYVFLEPVRPTSNRQPIHP